MTSSIRRTEIQIETHEFKIIRPGRGSSLVYCESCGTVVAAATPEQAAEFFEVNEAGLLALIKGNKCHLIETAPPRDRGSAGDR